MKKEKLIIALDWELGDKTKWSGTYFNMFESLKTIFDIEFVPIVLKNGFLLNIYNLVVRLVFKMLKKKISFTRPLWYRKRQYKDSLTKIRFSPINYVLIHNVVFGSLIKNKKIIYVLDATINQLYNYYDYAKFNKVDFKRYQKSQISTLNKSCCIVAASKWAADSIVDEYKIPKDRVHVVPFGANMKDVSQIERHRICKKNIDIVFCGVDPIRKGLYIAIETISFLNKKDKKHNYHLHVIGLNGKNTDAIHFYGFKNKNNDKDYAFIKDIYSSCDLFLLPTRAECAGIVFCEASMFSLPIIATNTGGVSSYVVDGQNGFLIDYDETIENIGNLIIGLIDNQIKYSMLAENGRKLYERTYNWLSWAKNVFNLVFNSGN